MILDFMRGQTSENPKHKKTNWRSMKTAQKNKFYSTKRAKIMYKIDHFIHFS